MTVTATRQSESIFLVPLAVSVVGRAQLAEKRGVSLDEALGTVPGVFAQSRYGSSDVRVIIRGFGARGAGDRSNAGTSRGIRVLLDGIPETEPDGRTSFDLIDLAAASRIEVVRSNASSLWGNAAGGLVHISTVPDFDRNLVSAQQMVGSFGLYRTVLQSGTRFGPASLALTFTNTTQKGYRAHSDSRRALVNSSLTSSIGTQTDLGVFISAANDLFHIPGPLTFAQATATPRAANATYASRDERRFNRLARLGITLRHGREDASSLSGMLFISPKDLQRSERNTFRDFDRYHLGGNLVYRNAYRINSSLKGVTIVGGDEAIQNGTVLFYSLTPEGTRGTELLDNKGEGAMNTGFFAQQELLFGEKLNVQAGARYDRIRYDYRSYITPELDAVKTFARVTPKIGISYRIAPTHSFYASVGGGIETPAGNETDPASTFGQDTVTAINPLLDPIHSTTYEVGTKQLVPTGGGLFTTLSYDAALYLTDVTNEIVPYRGGRFYFTAGKVRRKGAELGVSAFGSAGLEVNAAVTYSRNRYVRYTVDSVHYGKPGAAADYAGNEVAGVPDLFYNFGIARALGDAVPFRLQLTMRGVGEYFTDDANAVEVPAYHYFGATLATARPIPLGRFSLKAFLSVDNLTDRRFIASAFVNPDVVNGVPVAFEPGSPRTIILSVSVGAGQP